MGPHKKFATAHGNRCQLFLVRFFVFAACLVFVGPAYAGGEAVRLYVELSSDTATLWPTEHVPVKDYLRGRIICLDGNNELATEFNGKSIDTADLILASESYNADIIFAIKPATDLDVEDEFDEDNPGSVTTSLDFAWLEFAVSYDGVDEVGTDKIVATLQQGDATIASSSAEILVEAPLANKWVTRSGGVTTMPDVLDELPPPKENDNRILRPGDTVTLDVFGAFFRQSDQKFYFTNNIPEEALQVNVNSAQGTLEDGYVRLEYSKSGFVASIDSISQANDDFKDGKSVKHSAAQVVERTRLVGNQRGDVTDDEEINVTNTSNIFTEIDVPVESGGDPENIDTSTWKARPLSKITIVGLPVNEVTSQGLHKESGLFPGNQNKWPGTIKPAMKDWLKFLAGSERVEPPRPAFRVPGSQITTTYIYGAIVAVDGNNKMAPFYEPTGSDTSDDRVVFSLRRTAASGSGTVAVNDTRLELQGFADYSDGSLADTHITSAFAFQGFMPFKITATAATADGSIASITDLYISEIRLWDGSTWSDYPNPSVFEEVDEQKEGIDFIAQDTVASVTLTDIAKLDGEEAQSKAAEVQIQGKGREKSFELLMITTGGGSEINKGKLEGGTLSTITIPNDEDNLAKEEISLLETIFSEDLFFVFRGRNEDTNFIQYFDNDGAGITVLPVDPSKTEVNVVKADDFAQINVLMDAEEDHDEVGLTKIFEVNDIYSNGFDMTGATLKDSGISCEIFLPLDPDNNTSSASDEVFPGASVRIDETVLNDIETGIIKVGFDLDHITADQDRAVLQCVSSGGTKMKEVILNLQALKRTALQYIFVPVPGVSDTPVELFMADQNGGMVAPVTITMANTPAGSADNGNGNIIEVELESANGTIQDAGQTVELSTTSPRAVFSVDKDDDKSSMSVTATADNYDATTLVLAFTPDFDPPVVGQITTADCSFTIEICDNQDVDLANTEVSVLDNTGADITATLTRTNTDNDTCGTILLSGFPVGDFDYTATIVARDMSNNERSVSRSFSVSCVAPECLSVDPAGADKGESATITIQASSTNFVEGTTQVSFACSGGTGITIDNQTVISPTEIQVDITIGGMPSTPEPASTTILLTSASQEGTPTTTTTSIDDGGQELCDITIQTGNQVLVCEEAFTIGGAGTTTSVTTTVPATTTTIPQDGECRLIAISRQVIQAWRRVTRPLVITIRGTDGCSFNRQSDVDFGTDEINASVLVSAGNSVTCLVTVSPETVPGTYAVMVDGFGGVSFTVTER